MKCSSKALKKDLEKYKSIKIFLTCSENDGRFGQIYIQILDTASDSLGTSWDRMHCEEIWKIMIKIFLFATHFLLVVLFHWTYSSDDFDT